MSDSSTVAGFGRAFLGYRRAVVDDAIANLELRVDDLEAEAGKLREELVESQHGASEVRHDLVRARAELRYWNDRASYVDSEVARVRHRAVELERTARDRAEAIEADAQERSLQLVDRVCSEANTMLQAARDEAREMFLRFDSDVDMSQHRLDRLERARAEIAQALQSALTQFEAAVDGVTSVAPPRRIVELLEEPVRRARPTFGTEKAIEAMEAVRRHEQAGAPTAAAAPSSPPPTGSTEHGADTDFERELVLTRTPAVRRHPADEAFEDLLG